jgi:thiol-disulfide isomerase/thioredoxin
LDGTEDTTPEPTLTKEFDQRLRLRERGTAPQMPTGAGGQAQYEESSVPENGASNNNNNKTNAPVYQIENKSNKDDKKKDDDDDNSDNSNDDNDSDFDFDDDDDDPTLEAIRQRRLAELKRQQESIREHKAKGHGDYRIISQDEFLPECTSSKFVAVHFFHNDFERCKIMEHHLKRIATRHLNCKFVAVNVEKAPFFVTKLQVKTLPTLIVFQDGKEKHRLIGFEGLVDDAGYSTNKPDEFTTSSLGRWIESTGAIEYEGPDSDEEGERQGRSSARLYESRFHEYDEDH